LRSELANYIRMFEEKARRLGLHRNKLGTSEMNFLEKVWGPAFDYEFDGLEAEYPLKDFKGGDRYADFVYMKNGIKLLMEIDGFTTHARDISPGDFSDHLARQNDFMLQGWMILRFSAYQVDKQPMLCQRQIVQAIGHWWSLLNKRTGVTLDGQIWTHRKQLLTQLAYQYNGFLRSSDIARSFNIPPRTARNWIAHFVNEGLLTPERPNRKITGYWLKGYADSCG